MTFPDISHLYFSTPHITEVPAPNSLKSEGLTQASIAAGSLGPAIGEFCANSGKDPARFSWAMLHGFLLGNTQADICICRIRNCGINSGTLFGKAEGLEWWMEALGKSQGLNPRGRRPHEGFDRRISLRNFIHHLTPKTFPYNVILWSFRTSKEGFISLQANPREYHTQCYIVEVQILVELNPNILVQHFRRMERPKWLSGKICPW